MPAFVVSHAARRMAVLRSVLRLINSQVFQRGNRIHGLSEHLRFGITKHALGTGIPSGDSAFRIKREDGEFLDVVHDQPQLLFARAQSSIDIENLLRLRHECRPRAGFCCRVAHARPSFPPVWSRVASA